ncbi:DUF4178 domain-containing protein [candidate division CSSED10-310 bacterium]|uniref:DUF4178 domain-containing protein n=1 Tax=candidate division CSSED10-310 bacterium TaxID=2855610 RepID=A0ABV6YWX2_UNCC1
MGYIILFIILAIVLVVIIKKMKKIDKVEQEEKEALLPEHATIKNVGVGGVLTISGFSDDFQDLDFVVEKVNRYERGSSKWYELTGTHQDKKLFIEWEYDDGEFFITATSSKKGFRLSKLGLKEEDLVKFDEDQSQENSFERDGEKFYFEQSGEVVFYEDNRGPGEGFYAWNFKNEDETRVLTVEKWEGDPFEVFEGKVIDHSSIEIFKVK